MILIIKSENISQIGTHTYLLYVNLLGYTLFTPNQAFTTLTVDVICPCCTTFFNDWNLNATKVSIFIEDSLTLNATAPNDTVSL